MSNGPTRQYICRLVYVAVPVALAALVAVGCRDQSPLPSDLEASLRTPEALATFLAGYLGAPTPLPEELVARLQTPEGDEIQLVCPDERKGSDEWATVPPLSSLAPSTAPGWFLFDSGAVPNSELGALYGGGFATEQQLSQMGRRCGIQWHFALQGSPRPLRIARVDLYATSVGAQEALPREVDSYREQKQWEVVNGGCSDVGSNSAVGDELVLMRSHTVDEAEGLPDMAWHRLVLRRRNVVVSIIVSSESLEAATNPACALAEEIDSKIEAIAKEQLGPGH